MYTRWTSHLETDEDKENFRNKVLSAKPVLERLMTILAEEYESLERIETDTRVFDTPNWAEKMAFNTGDKKRIYFVQKLINLDQQET